MAMVTAFETIPALLAARVRATPAAVAFMEKDADGRWRSTCWGAFGAAVSDLARRLRSIGLGPGDSVAILMPNSVMWETVQHAVYRLGGVVIGLDLNDSPVRVAEIFGRCAPTALFVDRTERLRQLSSTSLKGLRVIIAGQIDQGAPVPAGGGFFVLNNLPAANDAALPATVEGTATATVLFTSGTTGRPKAFSYEHRQVAAAVRAIVHHFGQLPEQAHTACWLPLANPFQRIINFCALAMNWKAFMVPVPATIMTQVPQIAPHVFAAVPRFFEKVMDGIHREITGMPAVRRMPAQWALRIAAAYRTTVSAGRRPAGCLRLLHRMADRLVLRRIREVMGPHLRYGISGSAAMPAALVRAFDALGWPILEAYGISENIVPMAMNVPGAIRPGSVGRPMAENTLRVAPDGEILVKGIGVSSEAGPLTDEGFLKTGDLGILDDEGFLWLTGRKNDLFKLSTGRKVSPAAIEEALGGIDGVEFAVATGQDRRYVVALLNMDPARWCLLNQRQNGLQGALGHLRLMARQACAHLPAYCRPVDIAVVQDPFTTRTGELTTNMKLRRDHVLAKYTDVIEALYRRQSHV
ncbi:MAG: AMP-binding protein [Desulfatitalea sp.]|nr:AMP-binding protein [Desulfatitalea sp.]